MRAIASVSEQISDSQSDEDSLKICRKPSGGAYGKKVEGSLVEEEI